MVAVHNRSRVVDAVGKHRVIDHKREGIDAVEQTVGRVVSFGSRVGINVAAESVIHYTRREALVANITVSVSPDVHTLQTPVSCDQRIEDNTGGSVYLVDITLNAAGAGAAIGVVEKESAIGGAGDSGRQLKGNRITR